MNVLRCLREVILDQPTQRAETDLEVLEGVAIPDK
jgi:hypothetical protein